MLNYNFSESALDKNMNSGWQPKERIILSVVLIFISLCLLTNTNNNPNPIIQRIFRPIHFGQGGTIYYAAAFPLLVIYFSIRQIYQRKNYSFINTMLKRIIVMFLLLSILPTFSQAGIKLYKSFNKDLNSIYCYRENMNLSSKTSENKPELVCKLDLENCSADSKEFYVKAKFPSFLKEMKESTLINTDSIISLQAHERRQIEITFDESTIKDKKFSFVFTGISHFEFTLLNDKQEVKFTCND